MTMRDAAFRSERSSVKDPIPVIMTHDGLHDHATRQGRDPEPLRVLERELLAKLAAKVPDADEA